MIDRARLPREGFYVYILRDAEGDPVYVGQTENVWRRIYQHQTLPWFRLVEDVELVPCADLSEARSKERDLIWDLAPLANTNGQHAKRHHARVVSMLLKARGLDASLPFNWLWLLEPDAPLPIRRAS